MPELTALLLITIILALLFDFSNGWHDCANAVATALAQSCHPFEKSNSNAKMIVINNSAVSSGTIDPAS